MSKHDPLETWMEEALDERRGQRVPAGFAGRVMEQVRAEAESTRRARPVPWLLAGAWAAASIVLLVRLGAVVGVFWPR